MATAAELKKLADECNQKYNEISKTTQEYLRRRSDAFRTYNKETGKRVSSLQDAARQGLFALYGFSVQDETEYEKYHQMRHKANIDYSNYLRDYQRQRDLEIQQSKDRVAAQVKASQENYEIKKQKSKVAIDEATVNPVSQEKSQPQKQETQTRNRQEMEAKQKAFEEECIRSNRVRNKRLEEEKKQRKAEQEKLKAEKKILDKQRKEEEKAKDKVRRQQEHEKRVEERAQNRKEYDEALAKYKQERSEQKEKEKAEREEAAKKRHDEYVKQRDAKTQEGEDAGKKAYKQINDYTYTERENYEQQIKDGGYKGSSAQAKKELKESLGDLWNMSTGDARKELSGAYADISDPLSTLKNARGTVQELYKGKILGDGLGALKNSALNIQVAALAAQDKEGMVNLQKVILTQKLADRMVLDQISDAVHGQMLSFQNAGNAVVDAYLVQKAYVTAYVKQTFGNPQFMRNVTGVVAAKVGNYIEALTNEQVAKYQNKINGKIDSVFTKFDQKLDTVTEKINTKLDKLTKIDVMSKMNNAIDKFTSLGGLQAKLDRSPIGSILSPLVGAVSSLGNVAVRGMMAKTGVLGAVAKIQGKILKLQEGVKKAKEWIAKKKQMIKDFANKLKEKAKQIVTDFANKIVGDIKSKIQNVAMNALGGGKGLKF